MKELIKFRILVELEIGPTSAPLEISSARKSLSGRSRIQSGTIMVGLDGGIVSFVAVIIDQSCHEHTVCIRN